ncbi:hypothetical protein [Pseudomonas sp. O39]|uniref:hypothetical protein n=1 Tax=Pseudomonas sp. O39 TaxID=3379130 RepID=UPI00387B3458
MAFKQAILITLRHDGWINFNQWRMALMQQRLFFDSSKTIYSEVTAIFDFIWPTAAAMWNLRWQVKGLVGESPDISQEVLLGRFVVGSDIRGANLRRSCIDNTWGQQKEQFAKIMLAEFCALYEAWYSALNEELLGLFKSKKKKIYEYPEILKELASMPNSTPLEAVIYLALTGNKKCDLKALPHMISCYRFFKELRNGYIHNGGVAGQRQLDAYLLYNSLSATDLGVSEVPEHPNIKLGHKYQLTLRGVVGFGDVLLRLIVTLDAEFARKSLAEHVFVKKWKVNVSQRYILPANEQDADRMIRKLILKMHLKAPKTALALKGLLKEHDLVGAF